MAKFLRIIFECAFLCWLKKETTHQAIVPQCYFRLDFVVLPLRPPLKATSWWLLDLEESDIFFVPYASIPGASEKTNQRLEAGKSSQIEKDNHLNQSCILFGCFHVNLPGGGKLCVCFERFWQPTKKLHQNSKNTDRFCEETRISKIFWTTWRLCVFTKPYSPKVTTSPPPGLYWGQTPWRRIFWES